MNLVHFDVSLNFFFLGWTTVNVTSFVMQICSQLTVCILGSLILNKDWNIKFSITLVRECLHWNCKSINTKPMGHIVHTRGSFSVIENIIPALLFWKILRETRVLSLRFFLKVLLGEKVSLSLTIHIYLVLHIKII